jgi:hypothetical protein
VDAGRAADAKLADGGWAADAWEADLGMEVEGTRGEHGESC